MMLILMLSCIMTSFAVESEHNSDLQAIRREFAEFKTNVDEKLDKLNDVIKNQDIHIQAQDQLIQELRNGGAYLNPTARETRIEKMFLRPRQTTDKVVAFFATLSSSQQEHLGPHQNIIFGDVETNIGGGYNYHHGVLVAPVSGLYLITATLLTSPNREIWAAIVVNGVEVARLNGRGTDGRHGPTSHSVIIQLQRGDDVSVQNTQADDSFWGDKYSSFGGFLIAEM